MSNPFEGEPRERLTFAIRQLTLKPDHVASLLNARGIIMDEMRRRVTSANRHQLHRILDMLIESLPDS